MRILSRIGSIPNSTKGWVVGAGLLCVLIWAIDSGEREEFRKHEAQSLSGSPVAASPRLTQPEVEPITSPTELRKPEMIRSEKKLVSELGKPSGTVKNVNQAEPATGTASQRPSIAFSSEPSISEAPPSDRHAQPDVNNASGKQSPISSEREFPLTRPATVAAGYFTVGSTKDEVLGVQGTPTELNAYRWSYGLSHVQFQGDRVVSWENSRYNPLKVQMTPTDEGHARIARSRGYFTVGSTKDEVLGVQGTPTQLNAYRWSYGLSHVQFQGDRVVSWENSRYNPLKVRMIPTDEEHARIARSRGYFTVGSTKDEVLGVQGTPTEVNAYRWSYGLSHVQFHGDRVVSWENSPYNPLRARR